MALYKALMEDSPLPEITKPASSAPRVPDQDTSNSEGYTNALLTRKSSGHDTDENFSGSSTNGVMLKLPYTVLNPSRDPENTTCETASSLSTDPYHCSETTSSSAPATVSTEIKREHACETRFTEKSSWQNPSSEENPSLTCVGIDKLSNYGDNSGQGSSDDLGIRVDRNQPGPVTVQNLDESVSCFNCQIHHAERDLDNKVEPSINSSADQLYYGRLKENSRPYKCSNCKTDETDRTFVDQQTKNNADCKESICNKIAPNSDRRFDQTLTEDGQAHGHTCSLYISNQAVSTDKTNLLPDHATTDLVTIISQNGQTRDDDFKNSNQEDDQKDRIQAHNEQDKTKTERRLPDTVDLHIQNLEASQTESLLTKIAPDSSVNTESNTVLAEAMARRDAMVKDLSVDGSGLKVMCCLLGVIVVFAIAIITIVVTGL